jgi:hypothetical protein
VSFLAGNEKDARVKPGHDELGVSFLAGNEKDARVKPGHDELGGVK